VRILNYHPTRRRILRALVATVLGAPIAVRLGRVLDKQPKLVRPDELPEIPWIGHC
jgi:hypothetical protein